MMKTNRRDFVLKGLMFAGAGAIAVSSLEKLAFAGAPELKLVDEKDPVATALKFVHDGSKADAKARVDKMGVVGKNQTCGNCALYTKEGKIGKDEVGKCGMLAGKGVVKTGGWCSGWGKKA